MEKNIIEKLKEFDLRGRGGGNFETWIKWTAVQKSKGDKYVVCNGADGEIAVSKDGYILENYMEYVIAGIVLALKTVGAKKAYLYLRGDYIDMYKGRLIKLIGVNSIEIFRKPNIGYIGGEETVICELIESKSAFPRKKPPYVSEVGVFGCPTLINNIETFYCVGRIAKNEYSEERFYSVFGEVKNPGVFELASGLTIREVLKQTGNLPSGYYFVRAGGWFGKFRLSREANEGFDGLAIVEVFDSLKVDYFQLIKETVDFFHQENCDKCTPCREGFFEISEMASKKSLDWDKVEKILFSLTNSSFCFFGKGAASSLKSLFNIIQNNESNQPNDK